MAAESVETNTQFQHCNELPNELRVLIDYSLTHYRKCTRALVHLFVSVLEALPRGYMTAGLDIKQTLPK